jgi:hypothetical protein
LERVRTQQVAEGGGDLRLLGRFFLLFVEALSFVEPVSGVLRSNARGCGRVGHVSGDRSVEFVGWGVQVGQWQLGAGEGVAECGDGGLVFLRCVVGGVSSLNHVAGERRLLRSGPAVAGSMPRQGCPLTAGAP